MPGGGGSGSGVWAPATALNPVEELHSRGSGAFLPVQSQEGSGKLDARFIGRHWRRGPPSFQRASGVLQPMGENEVMLMGAGGGNVLEPSGSLSSNSSSGRLSSGHMEQLVTMAGSKEPSFSVQHSLDTSSLAPEWPTSPGGSPRAPTGNFLAPSSGSLNPYGGQGYEPLHIPDNAGDFAGEFGQSVGENPLAESPSEEELSNAHFHLPQAVLSTVATSLQSDLTIAAFLVRRVAETVLCEPRGLITLPVRMSKALLAASHGKVKCIQPSEITTIPKKRTIETGNGK